MRFNASSDTSNMGLTMDFSEEARERAFASIRCSKAPAKERLEAADYLSKYAATLSSIFEEYSLRNDHYKGMVALSSSVTNALADAKKALPELETHLARLPAFTIGLEERNSLYDAIIEEEGKRYEHSDGSQERTIVPPSLHRKPHAIVFTETYLDFSHQTRTSALCCLQDDKAPLEECLKAAEYLFIYEATLQAVLEGETWTPAWPALHKIRNLIFDTLAGAKNSVSGLEALEKRLDARNWRNADRGRLDLLGALHEGDLFEEESPNDSDS
jgi:hypothetical protein